jgi:dipeptidyl aminopeptidase/acylaminoacyl peptidase
VFNTYLCGQKKGLYDYADCKIGVYSIDVDMGKINPIAENISGNSMWNCNFEISPDGKYVSVSGAGQINIYFLSSGNFKVAYPNMLTYYVTTSDEYLPKQYWLTDSSGLIIIVAAEHESNEPATPPALYVAFRYSIGDKQAVQIPFDKFIMWDFQSDTWCISPDRNWILFAGNDTGDRRDASLYYLGNLTDGHTQAYSITDWPLYFCKWSPDSRHFAFTNTIGFIGSVDGSLPIPVGGHFLEWIDSSHYYYMVIDNTPGTSTIYIGTIGEN